MAHSINVGKTAVSVQDALMTAGIDIEGTVSVVYGSESAAIIQSTPDETGIDENENTENLLYVFRLLAKELDTEALLEFKKQLTEALENPDGKIVEDFIEAASMMGSSFEDMEADVKAIKEDLKIPSMDDTWGNPETHDFNL